MPQYQGIWTLAQAAQLQSTQRWATDPLFENTTLLLQADNAANGAQNNTFLDSSSNNFTITRNGNTTQGTFTPFSATGWSNFFDGTGDYLSNTSTALITNTVSTFTCECWVYLTATPPGNPNNISSMCTLDGQPAGPTNYMSFGPLNDGKLYLFWFDGAVKSASGSTVLALNTWYHIACVVTSNSIKFYVNGVAETMGGTTTLTNRSGTQGNFAVGSSSSGQITGYISNFRVTTTAVYAAAFTPSTTPLTPVTGTVLLTCQSNQFVDTNTQVSAKTLTITGTPSVQAFSPFAPQYQYTPSVTGGSGYFDGTGDYLSTPDSTAFDFGTGSLTVEAWIYTGVKVDFQSIVGSFDGGSNAWFLHTNASGTITYGINAATPYTGTIQVCNNSWNHIAMVRNGSSALALYVNGVLDSSQTNSTNVNNNAEVRIGSLSAGATRFFNGYISGVRVVNGTAVYTAAFTPPTAPLTAITNTQLLLNFTNAGIYDGTLKNNLETVGNAQVSTSVVKYGTGSMYFDGSGDYLFSPFSPNFQLGTGDFTIECWINASVSGSFNQIVGTLVSGTEAGTWRIGNRYNSTNAMYFARGTGAGFDEAIYSNVNVNDGLWHHIACVRLNGVIYMYVDGVARTVTSGSASIAGTCSSSNPLYVGYNGRDNSYITGYLDDLRITRGIARYTANFTPPSVALPRQ